MEYRLNLAGIPQPTTEYSFYPLRGWRFDFVWPEQFIALEVEGGQFIRGRHQRPKGFEDDCRKYNIAAILGYVVIRVTRRMIENGEAVRLIKEAMTVNPSTSRVREINAENASEYFIDLVPADTPTGYNVICHKKGEAYEGVGVPASRFEVLMYLNMKAMEKERDKMALRLKAMRKEKKDEALATA